MSVPVLVSRCGGQRNTGGRALRVFVEIVAVRLAGMTRVATKHPRRCGQVASLIGLVHFGEERPPSGMRVPCRRAYVLPVALYHSCIL